MFTRTEQYIITELVPLQLISDKYGRGDAGDVDDTGDTDAIAAADTVGASGADPGMGAGAGPSDEMGDIPF